jgi:hypothetical protein
MTLDDISDGRVTAGIGAGGDGFDATALGTVAWLRRERTERFEEFVAMLDRLLSEPATSSEGRYYVANEARAIPGCRQRPRALCDRGHGTSRSAAGRPIWFDMDRERQSRCRTRPRRASCRGLCSRRSRSAEPRSLGPGRPPRTAARLGRSVPGCRGALWGCGLFRHGRPLAAPGRAVRGRHGRSRAGRG